MEGINKLVDLQKSIRKAKILLVDFTASWCAPCKGMKRMLKKLEKDFPEVDIVVVDIDLAEEIAEKYEIDAVPTYILFKSGVEIFRDEGTPITYRRFVKKLGL